MKFKNNASSKLATSLTAEATTLEVIAGTGSNFPTIVSPKEYFHATLVGDNGDMEIIRVTNISGDTFTVVRAQEDTVAKEWPAGTRLENRITAEFLNQVATGDTIKFDQVTIKTDSEGVSSVDPAEVYPPASSTELGVVKVDEETITISEDNAISVLPSGIIDNNTIVLDENGKLTSKSISFDNGDIFDIYLKPGVSSLPSVSTPSGDGLATSIVPDLSSSDMVGTFYEGKSFGHVNGTKFVFDTDGFYIVSIRWIIQPLPEHQDADNVLELMQETSDGSRVERATIDFELDLSNNLGAHATLTYPIWGKTGESIYSLLYVPSNSGTNKTSTVSWNMRIMRLPVTNEYQVSNSELNIYYNGESAEVPVANVGIAIFSPGDLIERTDSFTRKFSSKNSLGYVQINESGLYYISHILTIKPFDTAVDLVCGISSVTEDGNYKLPYTKSTLHLDPVSITTDVNSASTVRYIEAGEIFAFYIQDGGTVTGNYTITNSSMSFAKFPSLVDAPKVIDAPVGTVIYSASSTPPEGYLICNGAAVGRTTYPDLFDAIGTTYGAGDGSTTFNLPDLIGRVAWGGATPGQYLKAGLPDVTGYVGRTLTANNTDNGAVTFTNHVSNQWTQNATFSNAITADSFYTLSNANPIYGNSTTVQPPALTLTPYIKAFSAATNPGEVNVTEFANKLLPFTSPTASSAGKEGLVPAPEATPENELLNRFLSAKGGWGGIDLCALHPTAQSAELNKVLLDMGGVSGEGVNIDTLLRSGFFTANAFAGTLPDGITGGVLINIMSTDGNGLYYGQQILISYTNYRLYFRGNITGIQPGGIINWYPWACLTPIPQTATGVGQWQGITVIATSYTLPIGGVWAYYLNGLVSGQGVITEQFIGVKAGGALISAGQPQTTAISGLVWRIA